MLCNLFNPTAKTLIVYDLNSKEIRLRSGERKESVDLATQLVDKLEKSTNDLRAKRLDEPDIKLPAPVANGSRPSIVLDGMWGIGDNLHQRAAIRELMRTHDVWLSTCHHELYHDLVEQGLTLTFKSTNLRAQARTIARERGMFAGVEASPSNARRVKIWYKKDGIDRHGSILATILATCGVSPERPDFSLPIRAEWREQAKALIASWDTGGRAIMVYRPVVLRKEWNSASRNPDPQAYAEIFAEARKDYFVVSIADLEPSLEWIVGTEQHADVKLHRAELDFPTMAALFAEANIGFFNAGFAPVLAQAVGLPSIVVYGGRESYRTTQAAGAHLAPTLGIDPIRPCDCHTEMHPCDKRIDVPKAVKAAREFAPRFLLGDSKPSRPTGSQLPAALEGGKQSVAQEPGMTPVGELQKPLPIPAENVGLIAGRETGHGSLLLFGTVYCDNVERQRLTEQWIELNSALNPQAHLLLVDSASPVPLVSATREDLKAKVEIINLGDNIGHLSRGGRDGWGRAFCKGLEIAVERGFATVAHVEGDSLLSVPVAPLAQQMRSARKTVASVPVKGMVRDMPGWVETGLMLFDTKWLRDTGFVRKYDWPNRKALPTPEVIIGRLVHHNMHTLPLNAVRNDKGQFTHKTIAGSGVQWLTHCHNDVWAYDRFFEKAIAEGVRGSSLVNSTRPALPEVITCREQEPNAGLRLNLGCGTNKLKGWTNHDADVDITKPLPWPDNSADFIFIEHCVEHVSQHEAVRFFIEAHRVLKPGGVFRVTVPSLEQIAACNDPAYFAFAGKWGGEPTRKGAMQAIIFAHGHQAIWTASAMRAALDFAGFENIEPRQVGHSPYPELVGVEGHQTVIGEVFNTIESMPFEAVKPVHYGLLRPIKGQRVAVVLGGGKGCEAEYADAKELISATNADVTVFAVNDWIARFQGPCIAISLHPSEPEKLPKWLTTRKANGFIDPLEVWAHKRAPGVTNVTEDWSGSSGLLAVKVARQIGFKRVILCGVPMEPEAGHFIRGHAWTAAQAFRKGWERHRAEIAPLVRSMSGWTRQLFGAPDAGFLSA